jgi:outer membrane protein
MNGKADKEPNEQSLVRLYMDLTGAPESGARSVFMYVCTPQEEGSEPMDGGMILKPAPTMESSGAALSRSERRTKESKAFQAMPGKSLRTASALLLFAACCLVAACASGESGKPTTNSFPTHPLSLADAVNIALEQSPAIRRAQKDVESVQGVVLQTRAVAMPKVNLTSSYSAVETGDIDLVNVPGLFSIGNDQNWSAQIRLVQSIYEGGRVASALRVAKLAKEQSKLNYDTTVSDAVLAVELAYNDVLLADQQIVVQQASLELLNQELADTTRRYDAGTVPRFNVLRAEVEVANARPRLIRARNSFRISKNNLANLLGFNIPRDAVEDIPMTLSGKLEAQPYKMDLPQALGLAQTRRTELGALRKTESLRQEDVISARAGYKPNLQIFAGYDAHNSNLSPDLDKEKHGWIAGAQLSWSLFDGMLTRGRVVQAQALYERAGIELEDTSRRIELEVRTAFSNFREAEEVLESQKKVLEEAEEALRLATARSEAGTGTQLDVLSAQTALTEARTTQIQALHDYAAARARLERAVGMIVPAQP